MNRFSLVFASLSLFAAVAHAYPGATAEELVKAGVAKTQPLFKSLQVRGSCVDGNGDIFAYTDEATSRKVNGECPEGAKVKIGYYYDFDGAQAACRHELVSANTIGTWGDLVRFCQERVLENRREAFEYYHVQLLALEKIVIDSFVNQKAFAKLMDQVQVASNAYPVTLNFDVANGRFVDGTGARNPYDITGGTRQTGSAALTILSACVSEGVVYGYTAAGPQLKTQGGQCPHGARIRLSEGSVLLYGVNEFLLAEHDISEPFAMKRLQTATPKTPVTIYVDVQTRRLTDVRSTIDPFKLD